MDDMDNENQLTDDDIAVAMAAIAAIDQENELIKRGGSPTMPGKAEPFLNAREQVEVGVILKYIHAVKHDLTLTIPEKSTLLQSIYTACDIGKCDMQTLKGLDSHPVCVWHINCYRNR